MPVNLTVDDQVKRNVDIVRRIVEQGFNAGDLRVALACADNFVNNVCAYGVPMGPPGLSEHITMIRQAYPDIRLEAHDVVAAADTVCVRWISSGTAQQSYMGNPPSGYTFRTSQIAFYRFAGGQLVDWSGNYDSLAMGRPAGHAGEDTAPPGDSVWSSAGVPAARPVHTDELDLLLADPTAATPSGLTIAPGLRLAIHRREAAFGRSALAEHQAHLRETFACDSITTDRMLVSGDKIALRWSLRGWHRADFIGIRPTGRPVTLTSSAIATMHDSAITSWVEIFDEVGFLDQTRTQYLLAT
jgi:predicted ester cyclase